MKNALMNKQDFLNLAFDAFEEVRQEIIRGNIIVWDFEDSLYDEEILGKIYDHIRPTYNDSAKVIEAYENGLSGMLDNILNEDQDNGKGLLTALEDGVCEIAFVEGVLLYTE